MISRRLATAALALLFALGLALPAASPAIARDYTLGSIEIGQPWTRATPPTAQAGGGFLVLTNKGTTPDRLVAVKSPAADKVEIHEMKMDGNVMRMRELEKGIEIPPGATVELKPGGFHIMFMGLRAPFAKDAKVPATLVFDKAGSIDIELSVQAMGAQPPAQHMR
jgi:copper(I)-binding protein